jgi:hypothetical protein
MTRILVSAALGLTLAMTGYAQAGQTLDTVKSKGQLVCGVSTGTAGFAMSDSQGTFKGLDVDVCHALSAAIFGVPDKVRYVPLSAPQRFTALQSGEIDVLARNTTWTLQREGALGLVFAPVTFYDGQGFIVAKKLGIKSAKELSGATICVQPGTTTELNLADYFRTNKLSLKSVTIENLDEVENEAIKDSITSLMLTISEKGYGKRTPLAEYRITSRGGKGVINLKSTDRNGPVVAALQVSEESDVMIITEFGKIIRVHANEIREAGRPTQGVRLLRLEDGDKVAAAAGILEEEPNGDKEPPKS